MKINFRNLLVTFLLFQAVHLSAQHQIQIDAQLHSETHTFQVSQKIIYKNQSQDTLQNIILNDWNNAYSSKKTPLAGRVSDEFVKTFHTAKATDRGFTTIEKIESVSEHLTWARVENHIDLISIKLEKPLLPQEEVEIFIEYLIQLPNARFTKYGYDAKGNYAIKNTFLWPALREYGEFVLNSNLNLDDAANALADLEFTIQTDKKTSVTTDLDKENVPNSIVQKYSGKNRYDFSLYIENNSEFLSFKNKDIEVLNNIKSKNVNDILKAVIVDRVVEFAKEKIGDYPYSVVTISQVDYERNPFYGFNQLPSFLKPFPEEFDYEINFLKTYLNAYIKNSLPLNKRSENWIYDGITTYYLMEYLQYYHPDAKMLGKVADYRILNSFHLANIKFNEQFSYFYMLMARKNLDQPIGDSKNTLIKFNEQIAGKYRAGLSFQYLDDYLGNDILDNSVKTFFEQNKTKTSIQNNFESILKSNTSTNIEWFFEDIIHSRRVIDYKFGTITKDKDFVYFDLKNKTGTNVPIPVYGLKDDTVVFKTWLDETSTISAYKLPRMGADKVVLNYENVVPEMNLRNNWKSLKDFNITNRPIKFTLMKDLENPYYNQILYVPTITYNLYDGLIPGIRFHNKTILDKPFIYDINPAFSTKQGTISGSFLVAVNQNYRGSNLYNMRYSLTGNYFHYAPDASYLRLNPLVMMKIRTSDFRDNQQQAVMLRQVIVSREKSEFVENDPQTKNYSVSNAKYYFSDSEATKAFGFVSELQYAEKFGKGIVQANYRKLFENNTQIDLRFYAGVFAFNKTQSDFFNFALDRPTDYLFDYNYYGRSETTGLFSQQLILAEGGFKSKFENQFANQWMTTLNFGVNLWNWVEVYGDVGFLKNKGFNERFIFDSGVRLNLVQDYFELYFPIVSSNGWEIAQERYDQKIRFVVTLNPKILLNLFNRKWL